MYKFYFSIFSLIFLYLLLVHTIVTSKQLQQFTCFFLTNRIAAIECVPSNFSSKYFFSFFFWRSFLSSLLTHNFRKTDISEWLIFSHLWWCGYLSLFQIIHFFFFLVLVFFGLLFFTFFFSSNVTSLISKHLTHISLIQKY